MPHPYLNDARRLFEQSEGATDPSRKYHVLEEALELVDLVLEDSSLPQPDRELAENLRHAHIRRLLSQLVGMRVQLDGWFDYVSLLLVNHEHEVKTILDEDSSLKERYLPFVAIWKDVIQEALELKQKKGP